MSNTADRLVAIGRGRLIASTTVTEFVGRADGVRVRSPQVDMPRSVLTGAGIDVTGRWLYPYYAKPSGAVGSIVYFAFVAALVTLNRRDA